MALRNAILLHQHWQVHRLWKSRASRSSLVWFGDSSSLRLLRERELRERELRERWVEFFAINNLLELPKQQTKSKLLMLRGVHDILKVVQRVLDVICLAMEACDLESQCVREDPKAFNFRSQVTKRVMASHGNGLETALSPTA